MYVDWEDELPRPLGPQKYLSVRVLHDVCTLKMVSETKFVVSQMMLPTFGTGLPDGTYVFRPKIPIWVNFRGSCND
jgi:hypothetical protein